MDVVRRATTLDQLLSGRIPYKGRTAGINSTSVLADLMAGPKKSWMAEVELMADEIYPDWRDHFRRTGRRLPLEMRKNVEPISTWESQRPGFVKVLLDWLGATPGPELIAEIATKLDAVLEFTIFVAREFLLRNYSLKKHHSDVFDQFQLQYLAMDKFVIVSGDPDLTKRTANSTQADRIMTSQQFLQSL
jgi:hypothetical protein